MNWNFTITNGPKRTQLNNGIVSTKGGMPLKEITATNENRFSMSRHDYVHTNNTNTEKTVETTKEKKWTANTNRDASSVAHRNRVHTVGYNSLNPDGKEFAFTAHNRNTADQALRRARNKGYVVPPKVVANTNSPIFY